MSQLKDIKLCEPFRLASPTKVGSPAVASSCLLMALAH